MKNPQVRDDVIALMIPEISSRVDRRADAASDVLNIIQTAASSPGGIESLLEAVGFFENGSHAYAAAQAVFAGCFPALAPAGPRL
jgi:hypothetical protein